MTDPRDDWDRAPRRADYDADLASTIDAIREAAAFARMTNDISDGARMGVMLTRYQLAALLRRLGFEEEATSTMSITYGIPDDLKPDDELVTAMRGRRTRAGGDKWDAIAITLDDIEASRDVAAARLLAVTDRAGAIAIWLEEFLHATVRFDTRIRSGDRARTPVVPPKPDCTHANMPTDTEDGLKCDDCERIVGDDYEEAPMRQCNREACDQSGQPFHATDGQNCPGCNTRFTARIADIGCDECLGESGMSRVQVRTCPDCEEIVEVDDDATATTP